MDVTTTTGPDLCGLVESDMRKVEIRVVPDAEDSKVGEAEYADDRGHGLTLVWSATGVLVEEQPRPGAWIAYWYGHTGATLYVVHPVWSPRSPIADVVPAEANALVVGRIQSEHPLEHFARLLGLAETPQAEPITV